VIERKKKKQNGGTKERSTERIFEQRVGSPVRNIPVRHIRKSKGKQKTHAKEKARGKVVWNAIYVINEVLGGCTQYERGNFENNQYSRMGRGANQVGLGEEAGAISYRDATIHGRPWGSQGASDGGETRVYYVSNKIIQSAKEGVGGMEQQV